MKNQETDWLPFHAEALFAANVKKEREERRMTQAALARQMTLRGVPLSQSGIAKLEREDDETRRPIRLVEAATLAAFFGKSLDDMASNLVPFTPEHAALQAAQRRASDALMTERAAEQALSEASAEVEEALAEVDAAKEAANKALARKVREAGKSIRVEHL